MGTLPVSGRDAGGGGKGCVVRVVRVSGTMRKAEEEAVRRARREIVRLRGAQEEGVLGGLVGGDIEPGAEVEMQDPDDDEMDSESD